MILTVAGLRGAGKSLFGAVAISMGFEVFEMHEPILTLMRELGIEITNQSVREFASDFREKGGADAVAKIILPKIKLALQLHKTIIIIGARSKEEISVFSNVDSVLTVALLAQEKIRFQRIVNREKQSDPKTIFEFRWADNIESKWGVKKLLENCEVKIENNSSKEEFENKVKFFLKSYM